MAKLLTYSPIDVSVSIAGLHTLQGYSEDTFINITKDVKPFDIIRAMDGSIARIYRHDEGFKLELTIAQSSPSNNILSALYNLDTATRIGKFPVFVTDNRGSTRFFALTCWVENIPEVTFSNKMETRTWTLACTQGSITVGGNAEQSLIEQALDFGSSLLPLFREFGVL